ncbi:MAG: ribonuclease HI family protein [Acidobacteria bacterium]|nr:ribonuclease HI family protein [Acidobacteriota bacterium]
MYFDGASRGNPGPASYGVYSPDGISLCEAIGVTTNNVAEWRGFLAALDAAVAHGAQDVEVRADSQLVLKQFTGEYKMKAPHLAQYLAEARKKAKGIARVRVTHVPREKNKHADALANAALDAKVTAEPAPRPAAPARGQGSLFD